MDKKLYQHQQISCATCFFAEPVFGETDRVKCIRQPPTTLPPSPLGSVGFATFPMVKASSKCGMWADHIKGYLMLTSHS